MNDKITGIIRHVLTLVGGVLVAFGWIDTDLVEQGQQLLIELMGVVMALIGFVASIKHKDGVKKQVDEALKTPVPE